MGSGRWKYIDSYGMDRGQLRTLLHTKQRGLCAECQEPLPKRFLTSRHVNVDHVWPQSHGGPSEIWNVALTHARCNALKGDVCRYRECPKCQPEEES